LENEKTYILCASIHITTIYYTTNFIWFIYINNIYLILPVINKVGLKQEVPSIGIMLFMCTNIKVSRPNEN
jgi:hypothetical protein